MCIKHKQYVYIKNLIETKETQVKNALKFYNKIQFPW